MLASDRALRRYLELIIEARSRKSLAPYVCRKILRQIERELVHREVAVGFDSTFQLSRGQPFARHPFELHGDARQFRFRKRQPGGKSMATEADDHPRRALGHQIQCVAQVKPSDGASGAAKLAVCG